MSTLQYRGAPAAANTDLVYQDYLTSLKTADMTTVAIDNAINAGLAGYATIAYADQQDALNATKAYIDAGDALRIALTDQNIAGGVAPLDANAKVSPARINAVLTQRWIRGPWTPVAYPAAQIDVSGGETALYSCPVSDPGWPYKLVVFGMLDARSNLDAEYAIANVRVGNASTGEIIAQGFSMSDAPDTAAPLLGDNFTGTFTGLSPSDWTTTVVAGAAGGYDETGGQAAWTASGGAARTLQYQRLTPADLQTQTDYQKIRMVISTAGQAAFGGGEQYVTLTGRMNAAGTSWTGLQVGNGTAQFLYSIGGSAPAAVGTTGSFNLTTSAGSIIDFLLGTTNSNRQLLCYRNNVLINGAVDATNVTSLGPSFRNWGFIAHADVRTFGLGQTIPPSIDSMLVDDAPPSFGSLSIAPNSPATMATRNGPTTLYVTGSRSGTASIASFTPYYPRLTVFAVPA